MYFMPQTNPKPITSKQIVPFWLAAATLLVVAAVIILITSFLVGDMTMPQIAKNNDKDIIQASQQFSYSGQIKSIGVNQLVVLAKTGPNQDKETSVVVNVSDQTQYSGVSVPKTLPSGLSDKQLNELFKTKEISFKDLKVGDQIVAMSKDDVFGKTEMLAIKIQRTNVQ
ncbi:MAG: hypothetical protein COY09_01690 [Candidatus Portnoybacteria bacterium CG_4_10_14_0_2_um_filter_39_11]|uniref:Uncharacterized protein n=1 Tax=Candidatus Portnoybacteria bacterium CG_4_10_14_0_2_um_filter_39_11 TaxID=1974797 RepID=A0A2M7UIC9_9BACT|nr:MAG: hypothetical protein AUJ33_02750 [Parcubacteria group bacterium CG1_02_40_25]PIZ70994.1 MAG: hypothetical protein COY09_01690 [Candidatus Portnoybacteria bacterium CG_4_10_14_0_2_um_filter_39_11]